MAVDKQKILQNIAIKDTKVQKTFGFMSSSRYLAVAGNTFVMSFLRRLVSLVRSSNVESLIQIRAQSLPLNCWQKYCNKGQEDSKNVWIHVQSKKFGSSWKHICHEFSSKIKQKNCLRFKKFRTVEKIFLHIFIWFMLYALLQYVSLIWWRPALWCGRETAITRGKPTTIGWLLQDFSRTATALARRCKRFMGLGVKGDVAYENFG